MQTLPQGLDETIGEFSEQGTMFSVGQWQRIAIARALYKQNAEILIFDEPTASLDPMMEAQLYSDIEGLCNGKTTLFISHRLGITKVVDRILVFHKGRIVESGTHEQLMHLNGRYAQMYRAQAHWYA